MLSQICKRCEAFFNTKARVASTCAVAVSKENDQVLQKLGFVQEEYKKVLPKKRTIRELNLPKVVDILNRLGFTSEEIRKQPNILWLHPFLIDHRFKILEEGGVERGKITLERISKFARLNTTVIRELKKNSLLHQETDVVHSILSFSNTPLELYPPKTSDKESFGNAQTLALQTYISWKLDLSREEVLRKYQSYEDLHQKSIRLVMQSYDVLIGQLEIPQHKIKQNIYLLEGHPDNFLEILEKLPKIGDFRIQYVTSANPKILMRPVYKMLKVIEILKQYNVTDEGIAWYSNVLTLSPDTVRERAAALYSDPVFQPFFCSPRICFVISRYHTSMSRTRLLSDMKWRCLSTNLLTVVDEEFQKRVDLGHDESRGTDVVYYLKRHLGYEIKEIRKQLKLHPFFYLTPLSVVTDTLQCLLQNDIDKSNIFKALPIVLYPKEKVARWLKQVYSQPEVQSLRDEEGRLCPSLVLQLVLYYMERPYHFSGHGVWSEQDVCSFPYLH